MTDISQPVPTGNGGAPPVILPPLPLDPDEAQPVDLWGKFDPPGLPVGLLPPDVENFARVIGDHMGADPAGLAMAALTVLGAAIPDSIKVRVKQHDGAWTEAARLWTVLVGPPSTKKTPMVAAAVGPLARMDTELARDWLRQIARWNALDKEERKSVTEPPQRRLRIEDTTVEAAQEVLKGSPDGVLCVQDELSGWFANMERYGSKGADRAFWLRAANGGEFVVNRVGRGVAVIPNLSVSLLGGIQPEAIRNVAADAVDDGLLQRMFPIVLRPATVGHDRPMPPAQATYDFLVHVAHCAAPPATGLLTFDDGAQAYRRQLEAKHQRLAASEHVTRKLAAHIGKLDGLFARLCVIWHVVEAGYAPLPPTISGHVAWRVAAFMEKFLLPHAAAFYAGVLGLGDDHERLQAIAGFILSRRLPFITPRDVQRGDRAMRGIARADIQPIFEQLQALGWLGPMTTNGPIQQWAVNPAVHKLFEQRAATEYIRRTEAKAALAEIFGRGG